MHCVACRMHIDDSAYKCQHCGTLQDWRRHIAFGNTVLALLVALVSVSTVFAPTLLKLFRSDRADVRMTVLDHGPSTFEAPSAASAGGRTVRYGMTYTYRPQILFVNSGNGNGVINKVCISASVTYLNVTDKMNECHRFEEPLIRPGAHRTHQLNLELLHPGLPKEVETYNNGVHMPAVVGPMDIVGNLEVFFANQIGNGGSLSAPRAVIPVDLKSIEYRLVEEESGK